MIEILGQLEEYFNNTEPDFEFDSATCKYKNDEYEIWEVSESVFDALNNYEEEEWSKYFPNSWWIQNVANMEWKFKTKDCGLIIKKQKK